MWRSAVVLSSALVFVPVWCVAQRADCSQQELDATATISVRSVHVEGGQGLGDAAEAAAKGALQKPAYRPCELRAALQEAGELARRVYQEDGYYKAAVEESITRAAGADEIDVIIAVTPGAVYTLQDIKFTHVTVFPVEQLRSLFPLRSGDVFNARTFAEGLERMRKLYAAKGYINFTPVPVPEFDGERKSIVWTIDLDEGSRFTIGPLVLDGPEPAPGVGKRLIADWQPLIGQTFNVELLKRFLQEHAPLLGMRNPEPEAMFNTLIDNEDHIVTIRLNFPD